MEKRVLETLSAPPAHWVGDGFPVRSLFTYEKSGQALSPFLLLDHAAHSDFAPASRPRGVGEHPHRGFETVTIVYSGEVSHRDSSGGGGLIGPGDVQWMTAASGIVHEEFHSSDFTRRGGALEMVQLWVNLPSRFKSAAPRYQTLLKSHIPSVTLPGEAGGLRVIAGQYGEHRGPAQTFTPIEVWDVRLLAGRLATFSLPRGHSAAVVVLQGEVGLNEASSVGAGQVAVLSTGGDEFTVAAQAASDARLLVLSGEPIDEPIVGYGPFVMNSRDEIVQAIEDFRAGRFGRIAPRELGRADPNRAQPAPAEA